MLEKMVDSKQLEETKMDDVREVLLLRHRHLYEKLHQHNENGSGKYHLPIIRSLADIGKKYSEPKNMHHHGMYTYRSFFVRYLMCSCFRMLSIDA